MDSLENDLNYIKSIILKQNNIIKELSERIINLSNELNSIKNHPFFVSTGNKGVNQTNNHLNTSLNTNSNFEELSQNDAEFGVLDFKHISKHTQNQQEKTFNPETTKNPQNELKIIKNRLNFTFSKLSKQELKVFLTVYQLEDENIDTSYRNIAERMDLSEHCIRSHIHSLFRKNVPLYKVRINNKLTHIFVDKDFRSLNLKEKLINLFYQDDPYQKRLFDQF